MVLHRVQPSKRADQLVLGADAPGPTDFRASFWQRLKALRVYAIVYDGHLVERQAVGRRETATSIGVADYVVSEPREKPLRAICPSHDLIVASHIQPRCANSPYEPHARHNQLGGRRCDIGSAHVTVDSAAFACSNSPAEVQQKRCQVPASALAQMPHDHARPAELVLQRTTRIEHPHFDEMPALMQRFGKLNKLTLGAAGAERTDEEEDRCAFSVCCGRRTHCIPVPRRRSSCGEARGP